MKKIILIIIFSVFSVSFVYSMGAPEGAYSSQPAGPSLITSFIPFIIIYGLIALYVRHDNKKMRSSESIFEYKHNKESVYVEYRQWKFVWGLLFDSQKEVNKTIDIWNDNGYTCIGFQRSFLPNVSILKILVIVFITIVTFGFVNFFTGPTMLFIKSESVKTKYLQNKENG